MASPSNRRGGDGSTPPPPSGETAESREPDQTHVERPAEQTTSDGGAPQLAGDADTNQAVELGVEADGDADGDTSTNMQTQPQEDI